MVRKQFVVVALALVACAGVRAEPAPRSATFQVSPVQVIVEQSPPRPDPNAPLELAPNSPPVAFGEPPPAEVVKWVGTRAAALISAEAGNGFADMAAIGSIVGKARVVALGEATHGTREFFQLKHRILEYLVAEHGFTVFAIEANQPECRAINAYVLSGKGDPRAALDGIYFWTWNTEEVLAMIEWMKTWNLDPRHRNKVKFLGFDMQTTRVAYQNVKRYLAIVGADGTLVQPLASLGETNAPDAVAKAGAEERRKVTSALDALAKTFDGNQNAWVKKSGRTPFDEARQDVTVLMQATKTYVDPAGVGLRDLAMADNAAWILEHEPGGTRIVLWAHNGHIANRLPSFEAMGSHLRRRYQRDYVNIGFVWSHGSFQAIDRNRGQLAEVTLGPAPGSDFSKPFSLTGKPILALDLRSVPATGPVHDWFAAPHPRREVGAVFTTEQAMTVVGVVPDLFDAILFVDKTTRARPLRRSPL